MAYEQFRSTFSLFQNDTSTQWQFNGEIHDPKPGPFLYEISDPNESFSIRLIPVYGVNGTHYNGMPSETVRAVHFGKLLISSPTTAGAHING